VPSGKIRGQATENLYASAPIDYQRDVLLVPVVMVVRDVPVLVVLDVPGRVGERVPDGRALAVSSQAPSDLVRGRGDAPVEPVRKRRSTDVSQVVTAIPETPWRQDLAHAVGDITLSG
jgi:hypothetical protein